MAIVYGQIESLKRIKAILNDEGIDRFNSIGDINEFIKNYELEKLEIINQVEQDLNIEIDDLQAEKIKLQENYNNLTKENIDKLNKRILKLTGKYNLIKSRNTKNLLKKTLNWIQLNILKLIIAFLKRNFHKIIYRHTNNAEKKLDKTNKKIYECITNRTKIISDRSSPVLEELAFTREVVDDLYSLIAGAVGENLVVNELKKLSDKHILFNDFSIDFEKPIYYKEDNNRISSIQIDHLLVTNSGIFILETKNWSKKSIESLDLRSPIKQIDRTSFALYATLNFSRELIDKLKLHHWGEKKIPIRKVVVMTNQKPKEKFKFVKVTALNELNRYITYFDPIFDDSEVIRISEYLSKIKN